MMKKSLAILLALVLLLSASCGLAQETPFRTYECAVWVGNAWYELGYNVLSDFSSNGWTWEQEEDSVFALQYPGTACYVYARTIDNTPDTRLVMLDLMWADEIESEYQGFPAGPDTGDDHGLWDFLIREYGAEINEEGTLQARISLKLGRTLLVELKDRAVRLTLEE